MSIFPASSSILSASPLSPILIQKYNLSKKTSCSLLKSWINDTYLVQDKKRKYIFRIYHFNWRTRTEITEELRLINLLHAKNLPVSAPIPDQNGNFIQIFSAIEGERYGVLFTYAKGKKGLQYPPAIHEKIGSVMAKIHLQTQNILLERVTYTPKVLIEEALKNVSPFLRPNLSSTLFLKQQSQKLLDILTNLTVTNKLRKGAVHLDMWPDNMNITKDHNITIFDFDFCGNGWLCMDIAFYVMMLFSITPNTEDYKNKIAHFYKGYEKITPILKEEKTLLPMISTAIYFFYLGQQCQRFSHLFVNELYVEGFINQRIKKWTGVEKIYYQ